MRKTSCLMAIFDSALFRAAARCNHDKCSNNNYLEGCNKEVFLRHKNIIKVKQ